MKVAKQYIDLYHQTKGMINKHSSHILNEKRETALTILNSVGLPGMVGEDCNDYISDKDYAHTNINELFAPDYGLNLNRLEIPVNPYDIFHCDVPNMSTLLYFLVNDSFYNKGLNTKQLPENVFAGSLKEFTEKFPPIADKYYDKQASKRIDGTVAMNTLFAQDGFVLYVPKNTVLEKPLQLINILRSDVDFMVNRRLLIIVEENSQAKLLVCDHTINNAEFLANHVAEIFVADNAILDYYELEENSRTTRRVASTFVSLSANSNVAINGFTLTNGVTRNNIFVQFNGEGAEAHLSGMGIADGEQHIDNYTFIDHAVPNCHSNELFKYVLNDNAQGAFAGRILVRQGADKTEAFQSNKNLCITEKARMFTRPELEIYADDVKCSHGATIGQLDNQALFYLRSRGLREEEAKMLLMFAFSSDIVDKVRLEPLKERLRMLIEKRFRGELTKCKGCTDCK